MPTARMQASMPMMPPIQSFADINEAKGYANYLKSQYIVMFGPFDITDIFFDYGIDTAQQPDDLVCFEDDVLDRREATFAQYYFLSKNAAYTSGSVPTGANDNGSVETWWRNNYRVSTLTLNMEKIGEFLREYDGIDPETGIADLNVPTGSLYSLPTGSPAFDVTGSNRLSDVFSGMIYSVRTRRSPGITPAKPRWHIDNLINWRLDMNENFVAPQYDERTFGGPHALYHTAVRVWNGSAIDHGAQYIDDQTPTNVADDYTTKLGLTVITPGMMYVWGDYNTTTYPDSNGNDQLPPCALFCDRLIFLSNAWDDEDQVWNDRRNATTTTLNSSVIIGITPTYRQPNNSYPESGGVHNAILI